MLCDHLIDAILFLPYLSLKHCHAVHLNSFLAVLNLAQHASCKVGPSDQQFMPTMLRRPAAPLRAHDRSPKRSFMFHPCHRRRLGRRHHHPRLPIPRLLLLQQGLSYHGALSKSLQHVPSVFHPRIQS